MAVKYKKPFLLAIMINLIVGMFLIISGMLEFTGLINKTNYASIYTAGVQLSHLVFISGILTFGSGLFSLIRYKDMKLLNFQIILGSIALAWPLFVTLSLFFTQKIICIRLAPTLLASLYYIITILIVKMSNEQFNKSKKISTAKIGTIKDKRAAKGASVERVFVNKKDKTRRRFTTLSGSIRKMSNKFAKLGSRMRIKKHTRRRRSKNVLGNMFRKRY